MEEKRLECLMMLQIHRSDTPSIDAIRPIDRFATTAARRLNFLICTYMYQCTTLYSTIDSFLNRNILNTPSPDFTQEAKINPFPVIELSLFFNQKQPY